MNFITRLPGPLLVFFGATSLSFGGMIVKSFEGATLWQILFWRSLFFILVVSIFLLITYKKKVFHAFKKSGFPGLIGGIVLSSGFCGYVFAMYNTTVANANFIIQTQTIFLAIFGYLFLNYKKNFFNSIYKIGLPGFFGGIVLSCGYAGYVFAMYNTTVANANFIIQTQTIFLAIFGYIFLKEKISILTITSIVLAFSGIFLILFIK